MKTEADFAVLVRQISICLALICAGCSTTSNDIGPLPMLYKPLIGTSPCEISQLVPSHSLDTLNEKLSEHPHNLRLLEHRGWLLAKRGQYHRAIDDFNAALETETAQEPHRRATVLCRLGITYYTMGKLPEAVEAYSDAIEEDSDNWQLYFHRWLALRYAGRREEAVADRTKGLSLKPHVFELNYSAEAGII